MAPRSGKRRRRGHPPIPIWVPVHRPCLRSLNVPGPYYMPVPDMYLPPWVLPPPYFAKPMCHCANDDFCTPNSCRNSTDCLKSNPLYCPHGTKELDLQDTILEEEDNPDVGICSSCRVAGEKEGMSNMHARHAKGVNRTNGVLHEDSEQYNQGSIRDFSTRTENMPIISAEQGNETFDDNRSGMFSPQPYNECADLSCQTPFNSRDLQATLASRSGHLQTGTQSNVITDQRINRSSSGYAADSEPSDIKRLSSGVNKVSTCTGCSDLDAVDSSPANAMAMRNNSFGRRSRRNEPLKTHKIHIDRLPDQLAEVRKHGNQSRCCMSPRGSGTSCKMQSDDIVGSKYDKRPKDFRSRKASECGCSTTKLTSNKKTNPISNLNVVNHKATSCECRFPPAFNHLGCSGNRGAAKCSCSNNNPLHYSK